MQHLVCYKNTCYVRFMFELVALVKTKRSFLNSAAAAVTATDLADCARQSQRMSFRQQVSIHSQSDSNFLMRENSGRSATEPRISRGVGH
jgi:hypothetical protein